jgi:hypothetical protein
MAAFFVLLCCYPGDAGVKGPGTGNRLETRKQPFTNPPLSGVRR